MGNAIAAEDPPPLATEACSACVELAERALSQTLDRCHGVADGEIVAAMRWHLPQQSLATTGCEVRRGGADRRSLSTRRSLGTRR